MTTKKCAERGHTDSKLENTKYNKVIDNIPIEMFNTLGERGCKNNYAAYMQ